MHMQQRQFLNKTMAIPFGASKHVEAEIYDENCSFVRYTLA